MAVNEYVNKVDFGGNTLIDLTVDTLELPEQLLKGIIAHAKDGTPIEGTLEAGGGGNTKIAYGTITITQDYATGNTIEITHGLGIVPDFVLISLAGVQYSNNVYEVDTSIGFQKEMTSIFGNISAQKTSYKKNSTSANNSYYYFDVQSFTSINGIESTNTVYAINNATEQTFLLGASTLHRYYSGRTYFWLAIGGLKQ